MSNPYEKVKGGRLTFKGGSLATRKSNHMKKSKKKNKKVEELEEVVEKEITGGDGDVGDGSGETAGEIVYTIDAAKRMKYEELFPVEAKKFGYDPKSSYSKSMEDALDDRVKKKADRYCK